MKLRLTMLVALAACESGADTASDVAETAQDTTVDTTPAPADTDLETDTPSLPDSDQVEVGARACCLATDGDRVVWSEDGDLWELDPVSGQRRPLVVAAGMQMNPALSGTTLVWADSRGGDLDLWTMDLGDRDGVGRTEPRLLRGGPGSQDQPALDGTRLVWIGRDEAPHTAREAEVWTMDLATPGSERRLTFDFFEQSQPDVSGHKIVWADFRHSPDAIYIDESDPMRNNADIFGWDLERDELFIVSDHPSKQLRPAISGDAVTWLDWRDINPEPKYSEFQVYARRLGDTLERRLAWSSWSRPELWRRPAIEGDVVVFVAEPDVADASVVTGLLAVRIDGGEPRLVTGSRQVIDSVTVRDGTVRWLGGGVLGREVVQAR